jgi:hypothetical protein
MLLRNLQPTTQLFAPLLYWRWEMDRVQHYTWYLPEYYMIPCISYAQTQRFCIELGGLNTTRHLHEEDCPFFHQLGINSKIIYTDLIYHMIQVGLPFGYTRLMTFLIQDCSPSAWGQAEFQGRESVTPRLWAVTMWFVTWASLCHGLRATVRCVWLGAV